MRFRGLLVISSLIAVGTTPLVATAHGPDKATNACIQAFVDTYVPKNRQVQVRKQSQARSSLGVHTRRYNIDLSARLGNGAELVTARCVASADGQVLSLDS